MNLLISMLVASVLPALAEGAVPSVACELSYDRVDERGVSVDFIRGDARVLRPGRTLTAQVRGFALEATLTQICASDGGPCLDAYDLDVSITKGESTSSAHSTVGGAGLSSLPSLQLRVGDERAFSLCYGD